MGINMCVWANRSRKKRGDIHMFLFNDAVMFCVDAGPSMLNKLTVRNSSWVKGREREKG